MDISRWKIPAIVVGLSGCKWRTVNGASRCDPLANGRTLQMVIPSP